MTALIFLIPLNILILVLLIFLIVAFAKEKKDEISIKKQLEAIKTSYDAKAKESEDLVLKAQTQMEEALKKAQAKEEESLHAVTECEQKIKDMEAEMKKKMDEVEHIEERLKDEATDRIKQFEEQQKDDVEKNMVSLVMNVTKKILEKTLTYEEHKEIIKKSISEIKFQD